MINLAYKLFFYLLIAQILLFVLIALPTSPGFKSKLVRAIIGSKLRSFLMWVHLGLCCLTIFFYLDLAQTEIFYTMEKDRIKAIGNGELVSELRLALLSYEIQIVQRNKYITTMVAYVSIALNMFIRMLYFVFKQRGDYDRIPLYTKQQEARTSTVTTQSENQESAEEQESRGK